MPGTTTAHPPFAAPAVAAHRRRGRRPHPPQLPAARGVGPEHQTAVTTAGCCCGCPAADVLLRVALRRTSLHRRAPLHRPGARADRRAAGRGSAGAGWPSYMHAELSLRTGARNDEFLGQVAASHRAVAARSPAA